MGIGIAISRILTTGPAATWLQRLRTGVAMLSEAEAERRALWLPVGFGAGIALYFLLPLEPSYALTSGVALAALAGYWSVRARALGGFAAIVLTLALGFGAAQLRAVLVAAPVLVEQIGPIEIRGRIVDVDARPDDVRVVLDLVTIDGLDGHKVPAKVRIVHRRGGIEARPGEWVRVRAVLMPPPPPSAPGAFDYQRQAFFERLGAVGFSVGVLRPEIPPDTGPEKSPWLSISALRHLAFQRIAAALPGAAGTIAAALITGEVGAIPTDVLAAMRDSGLAHLLSISGLHFGIVTAFMFLVVRQGLALIPYVALRFQIKKWAAALALAGACSYLLFSGASIPAQRSFVMVAIVLLAVLLDRKALSMRLVAWAAVAVLAISPESILGPSFQMSFAAVVALIAVHEATEQRFLAWRGGSGWLRRGCLHLAQIALTTLVAGLATAPFAIYHFNRFTAYALAANLVAIPLTSFWIMPWAVVATALMAFGLESWGLNPMAWGIEGVVLVAREVAAWDGAVSLLPAMPAWGLAATSIGGLWLCLWTRRWRLAGLPVIALGLTSIALSTPPDILVSSDGRLMAVRSTSGELMVSSGRTLRIVRDSWLRRDGQEGAAVWPKTGSSPDGAVVCDSLGCIYRLEGRTVALVRDVAALAEDCRAAAVVISLVPTRGKCAGPAAVIDRFDLWRSGAHALWLDSDGWRVENVREARGTRPWAPPTPDRRRGRS